MGESPISFSFPFHRPSAWICFSNSHDSQSSNSLPSLLHFHSGQSAINSPECQHFLSSQSKQRFFLWHSLIWTSIYFTNLALLLPLLLLFSEYINQSFQVRFWIISCKFIQCIACNQFSITLSKRITCIFIWAVSAMILHRIANSWTRKPFKQTSFFHLFLRQSCL